MEYWRNPNTGVREIKPIKGHVYAVEFEDGAVKIGSSSNCTERFLSLQRCYRGHDCKIISAFISEDTDDQLSAERAATAGLKPSEKKEIFPISFDEAVTRIETIIPSVERFYIRGRRSVLNEFPCLRRPGEITWRELEYLDDPKIADLFKRIVQLVCQD